MSAHRLFNLALVLAALTASFLLGWHSRGDVIYGSMFSQTADSLGMVLPVKNGKETSPKK